MVKILLLIGSGSFIGGICRYLLQQLVQHRVATFAGYGISKIGG